MTQVVVNEESNLPCPPLPKVPNDLNPCIPHPMRLRGRNFRTQLVWDSYWIDDREKLLEMANAERETLLAILTDEQYGTLYHYGYVALYGSDGGYYRVHYDGGNNASAFYGKKYAQVGLCCYVPNASCQDTNLMSNILALRVNERSFRSRACDTRPYEFYDDNTYMLRNSQERSSTDATVRPWM